MDKLGDAQCSRCGLLNDEDLELCIECDARKINAMYGAAAALSVVMVCAAAYVLPRFLSWLF